MPETKRLVEGSAGGEGGAAGAVEANGKVEKKRFTLPILAAVAMAILLRVNCGPWAPPPSFLIWAPGGLNKLQLEIT